MTSVSLVLFAAVLASPGPVPVPSAPSPAASASVAPATPLPVASPPGTPAAALSPAPATSGTMLPAAGPTPSNSPSATPTGTPTPSVPAGTAAPSPAASPSLGPTPLPYNYRFVPHQPEHPSTGQPQIFAVYLNERKLRSHGPINIKVQTNPEVVKVVSRSNGREGAIPRVAPGDFEATSVLPKIPFIAAGMTVDLEFTATSADGRKATVRVPVRLD